MVPGIQWALNKDLWNEWVSRAKQVILLQPHRSTHKGVYLGPQLTAPPKLLGMTFVSKIMTRWREGVSSRTGLAGAGLGDNREAQSSHLHASLLATKKPRGATKEHASALASKWPLIQGSRSSASSGHWVGRRGRKEELSHILLHLSYCTGRLNVRWSQTPSLGNQISDKVSSPLWVLVSSLVKWGQHLLGRFWEFK